MNLAKVLVFETDEFSLLPEVETLWSKFAEVGKVPRANGTLDLRTVIMTPDQHNLACLFIPAEIEQDAEVQAAISRSTIANQIVWIDRGQSRISQTSAYNRIDRDDISNATVVRHVVEALDQNRIPGIRAFLSKGSKIFTENFFRANGIGQTLDPCFLFVKERLGTHQALSSWSVLTTLVFDALGSVHEQFGEDHRERTKLQIGADHEKVCIALHFPKSVNSVAEVQQMLVPSDGKCNSAWLVGRQSANFFEINFFKTDQTIEVVAVFDKLNSTQAKNKPLVVREITKTMVEKMESASSFYFRPLKVIADSIEDKEEAHIQAAAERPRKSFSERMEKIVKNSGETRVRAGADAKDEEVTIKADKAEPDKVSKVEGTTEHIKDEKIIVKGEKAEDSSEQSQTIKGTTEKTSDDPVVVKEKKAEEVNELFNMETIKNEPDAQKKAGLLEDKLMELKSVLEEREQKVLSLSKEIEEIKDPSKSGAVSSVIDTQKEGLKDNISRLEEDLAEAEKREKDLMSMVDKAVMIKDEAMKKLKVSETKLRQALEAKESQAAQFERKIEELQKQKTELSEKLTKAA